MDVVVVAFSFSDRKSLPIFFFFAFRLSLMTVESVEGRGGGEKEAKKNPLQQPFSLAF